MNRSDPTPASTTTWESFLGAEISTRGITYPGRCATLGTGGEAIILLHGQGGHLENFSRNVKALGDVGRVYAPDALWHGLGPQPDFDERLVPAFVDQVRQLMHDEHIDRAHIVGQSMGGWTAMRLAHDHPDLVISLTLVTAQGYVGQRTDDDDAGEFPPTPGTDVRERQLGVLDSPTFDAVRSRLSGLVADPAVLTDELVGIRHQLYSRPETNASLRKVLSSYMTPGSPSRAFVLDDRMLSTVDMPSLVYWGDANPVPESVGRRMADVLRADFHCAANTGHWAQFESSEHFNRTVTDFIREVTP